MVQPWSSKYIYTLRSRLPLDVCITLLHSMSTYRLNSRQDHTSIITSQVIKYQAHPSMQLRLPSGQLEVQLRFSQSRAPWQSAASQHLPLVEKEARPSAVRPSPAQQQTWKGLPLAYSEKMSQDCKTAIQTWFDGVSDQHVETK